MSGDINNLRAQVLSQQLKLSLVMRRAELTASLLERQGRKVLEGPFKGMTLLEEISWSDGDIAPKLLGCYEEELHPAIQFAATRKPSAVLNIGCAEGYYAIGFARMLPQARIFALDVDPAAQAICRRAAEANAVADRVTIGGACTADVLRTLISQNPRLLLFVDCEGGELSLLDPNAVPELRGCDIIVECHDFINRAITTTLTERFKRSHKVENIIEGARDPNRYPFLRGLDSTDRWLVVNESRPETSNWLTCWAQ